MRTPEGKLKDRIKAFLKEQGAYYHMPVPTGYGTPTLDFLICYKGRFIAVEAKAPGEKPTPRQDACMRDIYFAEGLVMCTDNFESFEAWWNAFVKPIKGREKTILDILDDLDK